MAKKTTKRTTTREIGPEHFIAAIESLQKQLDSIRAVLKANADTMSTFTVSGKDPSNPCMCFPLPGCIPTDEAVPAALKRKR